MSSTTSHERVELAELCRAHEWSKAIRVIDSLLSKSCSVQDICNRAFCYSQLELHKHVIKDCDKAIQLDSSHVQTYILKGRAFSALGRKDEALLVLEQGYKHAVVHPADVKQLLELDGLLSALKQESNITCKNDATKSLISSVTTELGPNSNTNLSETYAEFYKIADEPKTKSEPKHTIEVNGKCDEKVDMNGESTVKTRHDTQSDIPMNGNHVLKKLSHECKLNNIPSFSAQMNSKSPMTCIKSSNAAEAEKVWSNKSDLRAEISIEGKKSRKFSVTRTSKTNSISVDFRLSRGIAQVNDGNYTQAISIFDQILRENPTYPEALVGRGTAYAFQRELDSAISDFSKAIECNPSAGEAWKRRGQAHAALGESVEAICDLTKALEFEPNTEDILHERGIVNFKFKDFDAAIQDLSECVKRNKHNKSAYTYLGLALASIGEYKKAEEAHKKSIQIDRNFLEAWGHLTQYYHELADPTEAMKSIEHCLGIDKRFAKAYHLRGLLYHGLGEHRKAIKDLSTALSIEEANIEGLYLRASCYHAVGEYGEAIKDYDAVLEMELDSAEKFVLQCMSFYQKEVALYTAFKVNSKFCWLNIDGDIDPLFKEYWCKRLHPKDVCEKVFRQPPLSESRKKGKVKKKDLADTKQKTALVKAADIIGKKIQYDCPGFLPNKRQHRMAGLAAIEIAQKVSKGWRSLQAEWKHANKNTAKHGKRAQRKERINGSQNRGGSCCSTSSLEPSTSHPSIGDRSPNRFKMLWHDVYSLAVKWRQISEPCDPVVWINKLSEEFNSGFGSHTPMILGQAKVVRYFPNHERTLEAAKAIIKDKLYVHNKADEIINLAEEGKQEEIMCAKSCSDLYRAVGEDFWLATWCNSTSSEGKRLEGTRITLLKMGEHGLEFSIRTPFTPSRWEDFDTEMTAAWEALCNACCGETHGSTDFDALEDVRDAILRMTYYWYNFMPLARGSAVVGFTVLLGLLLAANMKFTGSIPKGIQVDWQAILNFDPSSFIEAVKSWLYPGLEVTTSWKDYPDVSSTLATTGSVVAALSTYDKNYPDVTSTLATTGSVVATLSPYDN